MTHQEKLQAITEAIHKACPDLLELEKGCRVEYEELCFPGTYLGDNYAGNPVILLEASSNTVAKTIKRSKLKILGQPIGIAEVFRALEKKAGMKLYHDNSGEWPTTNLKLTSMLGDDTIPKLMYYWKFAKLLNDQSEEVVSLLYSIFYPNE